MISNVHRRSVAVPQSAVAGLLATLATAEDRVWPCESWPRMRFDRGLVPGALGGHGPVRYRVDQVDHDSEISFVFTGPSGFSGGHKFVLTGNAESATLRHELVLRPSGWARITWPLFFRPLHDALIEEAFDKVARQVGHAADRPYQRTAWVRLLRWATMRRRRAPAG